MGWLFSIFLLMAGWININADPPYLAPLYFLASGLFAIAGSIAFAGASLKKKEG